MILKAKRDKMAHTKLNGYYSNKHPPPLPTSDSVTNIRLYRRETDHHNVREILLSGCKEAWTLAYLRTWSKALPLLVRLLVQIWLWRVVNAAEWQMVLAFAAYEVLLARIVFNIFADYA